MNLGKQRHFITVDNPRRDAHGDAIATPDGAGGFTLEYIPDSQPEWWAAIERASVRISERLFAGTVLSHGSYVLSGRFHEGISNETRLTWIDRAGVAHISNVLDVTDPEGAGVETVALVSEVTV